MQGNLRRLAHLTCASARPPRRHEAQQRDGLAKYGWLQHDGERYGLQELWDEQFNISTAWVGAGLGAGGGLLLETRRRHLVEPMMLALCL